MPIRNLRKSIFKITSYNDDQKNSAAEIINTLGILLIAGLAALSIQRFYFDNMNFIRETGITIVLILIALIVLRKGKLNLAGNIVIWSMFCLTAYMVWTNYGLHDSALLAIPGLLIVAGLIFSKTYFTVFSFVCMFEVALLGIFELTGVIKNDFSYKTIFLDIIDMLIILGITALTIRIYSDRFLKILHRVIENEKVILENERKNRALISALPDLVFRIDSAGQFKGFATPNHIHLAYKDEEFLGKNITGLFPKDVAEKALINFRKALESKEIVQFEYMLNVNGVDMDWEARVVAIDDEEVIVVVRDITGRKKKEEALRINEEIFRSFMEYSPIYIFFKDQDTRAIRLSRNYEQMLHMPLNNILGKTMYELFPSELAKSMTEDDINIIKNGKMVKVVEEFDGRLYETVKFPITIQNKPMYLAGYTIDITESKKYEMQLKQYAEDLRLANNSKEKLFSIIAHDLRSPFLGILGSIQMLSTDYFALTEEEKMMLIERIGTSSKNTFELVENLLNWARMQSGKIIPFPSKLNLFEEISSVIALSKDQARHKNIGIENRINIAHNVYIDKDMLRTITRNLISNAIKFSIPGGEIIISSEESGKFILISVKDNGIGMDTGTLKSLFHSESAKSRMGTSNESGTGIGLLICREMIELNNGNIWAESSEGNGSTFYFTIPKE